jgi:ABC-type multidrug transport system ATPase subunit
MFRNLSVLETLTYSALLRMPKSISKSEKLKRVESLIMELGLDSCRNVKIGDSESKGISGGQRKRVRSCPI